MLVSSFCNTRHHPQCGTYFFSLNLGVNSTPLPPSLISDVKKKKRRKKGSIIHKKTVSPVPVEEYILLVQNKMSGTKPSTTGFYLLIFCLMAVGQNM